MKIKTKVMDYEQVLALPRPAHRPPMRPNLVMRTLMRALSASDLRDAHFTYRCERMEELGLSLTVSPEALQTLSEAGYDPKYGARPLRRLIRARIEDAAAEALLSGALRQGDAVLAAAEAGEIVLRKIPEGEDG